MRLKCDLGLSAESSSAGMLPPSYTHHRRVSHNGERPEATLEGQADEHPFKYMSAWVTACDTSLLKEQ